MQQEIQSNFTSQSASEAWFLQKIIFQYVLNKIFLSLSIDNLYLLRMAHDNITCRGDTHKQVLNVHLHDDDDDDDDVLSS